MSAEEVLGIRIMDFQRSWQRTTEKDDNVLAEAKKHALLMTAEQVGAEARELIQAANALRSAILAIAADATETALVAAQAGHVGSCYGPQDHTSLKASTT